MMLGDTGKRWVPSRPPSEARGNSEGQTAPLDSQLSFLLSGTGEGMLASGELPA